MKRETLSILKKVKNGELTTQVAQKQLFVLFGVSGSLPSKDEAVSKGFNNANGSEYNRRNVLRDNDDDLYYTGWMDCFDWLVGNDR